MVVVSIKYVEFQTAKKEKKRKIEEDEAT